MSEEKEPEAQKGAEDAEEEITWDDVQEELERSRTGSGESAESGAEGAEDSSTPSPEETAGTGSNEIKPPNNLDFVLDVPLRLSVELGRTRMLISDLLKLGQGSVIELSKLVGEPMDILVNGKEIARGEVVVVNEKFGVRLTDIVNTDDRVQTLQ